MSESEKRKPTAADRKAARDKWANAPAINPRYKGATPADVARAMLGKTGLSRPQSRGE